MSASHLTPGNRNSTPETSSSNLRLPTSRGPSAAGHAMRASADMGAFSGMSQASRSNRPASEVMYDRMRQGQNRNSQDEKMEKDAQQWIEDIDQCEAMLDEMAAAALDHEFKDELTAIEQWFKVLSEAERTAALYALLQQSTQVQIRFFAGVLQQMSKSHPASSILSPSGYTDRDSMSNRLSSAMGKVGDRNSLAVNRNSLAPGNKRNSGLDPDEINSMFPDAVAAIAQQKADFEQQTGNALASNRNSAVGERTSLAAPSISAPRDEKRDSYGPASPSPWSRGRNSDSQSSMSRPKSSSGQQPMGQFSQPPSTAGLPPTAGLSPTAGMRSARPNALSNDMMQNNSLNPADNPTLHGLPLFSPYPPGAGWASMMNTPMVPNFGMAQAGAANDVMAATANRLGALNTIGNRMQLDAPPSKFRRARSTEGDRSPQQAGFGMGGGVLRDPMGQVLSPEQAAMMQQQSIMAISGRRSPTGSPAGGHIGGMPGMNFPPQNNGFLSVFGPGQNNFNNAMAGMNLGPYGGGDGGYLSDASGMERGRSPRGRRGTSKPPEDPTDPELLKDVPSWLRTLRLHKYTDNLKDMKWEDIIQLDEDGLEAKGVSAKGARTKMLKIFEQIRDAQASGKV